LFFSIHLLLSSSLFSQFVFDKAVTITKDNGLPTNNISSMKKGEDGFVWIATNQGLCRFDGQQVKVYREGRDLQYSLFDNSVNAVQPAKNEVWVGTNQGVSVLNTTDNSFRHFQLTKNGKSDTLKKRFGQTVNTLFKDRKGNIWIGTRDSGVYVYEKARDNFRSFPLPKNYTAPAPLLGPATSVLSITESSTNDSVVWAGTAGGLVEINRYNGKTKVIVFPQERKDYQVALNAFRRLYYHDDGLLYVGSWAAGIHVLDPVTNTFTALPLKNEAGKKIVNSVIGRLLRKSSHEFWISASAGIAVYDTKQKEVTWYKLNTTTDYEFYAIDFMDSANRAWYSDMHGVNYFDPAMQQFSRHSFSKFSGTDWMFAFYIISDPTGNDITVCPRMTDGIFHFNRVKNEWTKKLFPQKKEFKNESDVIRGFVRLPSGAFIISTDKGIYLYSESKNQVTDLSRYLPSSSTRWGEIMLDHAGNVWLSSDTHGLIKWNPTTHQYRIYRSELIKEDSIGSFVRIVNLYEDSRGNIWFERSGGLGLYCAAGDSIINFFYARNEANSFPNAGSFAEDKEGRVWISSKDGWLGYAWAKEPQKGVTYKINVKEKGLSGSLTRLATDNQNVVWGYTSDELVRINPDDLSFTRYSFRYGVGEADFYHFSFLPTGELIFGGRSDITIANPEKLKRNTEKPVPYISELQVLNQPFNFIKGSALRLRHRQNFFSIGFSAIAYTLANDVRFRYRLKNFDDWTESTGRRFANYTNVPGGDYVFQLQAANNEGLWNENMLELPIRISTPYWLTWWFRIFIALVVFVAVYSLYRYRVNQVKKKQKMKSEYEKKLANVEMTALLAQMNPHFLFNSLNSIDSYIIRNESKKASEYLNNFARLMRLILQNSRSNYISLKDELEALDLYLQMEGLRFKNKFSYSIITEMNVDVNAVLIPPMLIQPYAENAIWHGLMHKTNGEEGKVIIHLSRCEGELVCIIQDNGIGRKKAAALKANKHSRHKRSMGMQITQDRIEMINKLYNINASVRIIDLEDENGNALGTKVELIIPV
jgi:ligand-binding sensor domain-containing protein/two-component sensor histidine kinase